MRSETRRKNSDWTVGSRQSFATPHSRVPSAMIDQCTLKPDTHSNRDTGSPTYISLPGWQPVPSAVGWMSAMHATAACDHSGVVLFGQCCTSLDCCLFAPSVIATSRYGLLRAYTGEVGRLKRNCFESVGDSSRAGGDGGCVAGLSVVWCARSGWVRCA